MAMSDYIHRFKTPAELASAAAETILSAAQRAIAQHGAFKIVLAGGSTPNAVYTLLSHAQAEWDKWWIFWGDERCLDINDSERNSLMARRAWLNRVKIPARQIFMIPAEQGAKIASQLYSTQIATHLPFDMVLLGMGEDGHTASLFPCHAHSENELVHAVYPAPKLPAYRVSLSVGTLSNSEQVMFLIAGESKQKAFMLWKCGINLPVAQIQAKGETLVYIDQAALGAF